MTPMEEQLLDKEIKGVTGRFILWVVGSVGSAVVLGMGAYFAIIGNMDKSEYRITSKIDSIYHIQEVRDLKQDFEIDKKQDAKLTMIK